MENDEFVITLSSSLSSIVFKTQNHLCNMLFIRLPFLYGVICSNLSLVEHLQKYVTNKTDGIG